MKGRGHRPPSRRPLDRPCRCLTGSSFESGVPKHDAPIAARCDNQATCSAGWGKQAGVKTGRLFEAGTLGKTEKLAQSRGALRPSHARNVSRFDNRGRGECRVPNAPAAWRAHIGSEVCTPVFTAEAPETSGIPHAMVLRLPPCSCVRKICQNVRTGGSDQPPVAESEPDRAQRGEGKFGGVEQVVTNTKTSNRRALSAVLQNVFDAWMNCLGQPLPPISKY